MGGRRRARKRLRRRSGPSLLASLRLLLQIPGVRKALAMAVVYVVTLNAIVRYVGHGDAFLLSVFHLPDKSYAVMALALHSVKHVWSSHDTDTRELVAQAASAHGVPVPLALAIARTESGLRPHCISATGAMGLMQLMPGTALAHAVLDPFDPAQSADGGSCYLHELWQRYHGDRERVAAAYNAGAGRVPRAGPLLSLPAETRAYVSRVVRPHADAL
jgi:soluble lytic murein transglycosylase-like protein